MSYEEMILSTIKKVYAIRASIEKRTEEHLAGSLPLIGYILVGLAGTSLSKDQVKDVSAFITATCTTPERLTAMETISAFKAKNRVHRPIMVWLSYVSLFLPLVLVVAAEAYMYLQGMLTEVTYVAVALLLVLLALFAGLALFSVLSYNPEYRRDTIEHKLWKLMNAECQKRKKMHMRAQKKMGQTPLPAEAAPAVANNK
ncbi:hypothetical protein [Methanocella arvoryzae]|uniref:Uncharacterized protein n=1 Tax=Methanocella arvoryzae (strain DSM 22066 / NBRC 105507 / MRE50) TaxID=351160 RepID=Q0W696_METAR|nr:hypothetical protein [Methanocella arvoryzae]CAH04837.1 hypothetical protein orf5 [uncultured archaeon]CAJ36097.1 hypothetical protein RCIX708 [Methanocella arvoryzae MRE50]